MFPSVPCKWWLPVSVLDGTFCLLNPSVWETMRIYSQWEELQMKHNFLHDLILQFTQQGEGKQIARIWGSISTDMLKHACPHSLTLCLSHSKQPGFQRQNQNALLAVFLEEFYTPLQSCLTVPLINIFFRSETRKHWPVTGHAPLQELYNSSLGENTMLFPSKWLKSR